jgi:D-glycero-D-manno-heptose 1,7-bisphosphate phosphatase
VSGGRAAVFLDRDGVLNEPVVRDGKPYPPATVAEFTLTPDAAAGCTDLRADGYQLVVVTNQPDVARGTQSRAVVDAMHGALRELIDVDAVYVCPHDDVDGCDCRKPQPGMLTRAATDLDLDLSRSFLVGDRWRDVEAGRRAGVRTVWIDRGYREKLPDNPDAVVSNLSEAAAWIRGTIEKEKS